jgi:hypothetical protein
MQHPIRKSGRITENGLKKMKTSLSGVAVSGIGNVLGVSTRGFREIIYVMM